MNHHKGGGCSLGEKHSGPCEWGRPVRQTSNKPSPVNKTVNKRKQSELTPAVVNCLQCVEKDMEIARLKAQLAPKPDRKRIHARIHA